MKDFTESLEQIPKSSDNSKLVSIFQLLPGWTLTLPLEDQRRH